jgi:O-antigen/teichoic acid export membrane protein
LGIWGTASEVGIFGAATRVVMMVTFFLVAVNTVIAPKFVDLHRRGEFDLLGKLARRFALGVTLATSPLLLLLVFAGNWVMGLFGEDFKQGGTPLAILALGQSVNAMTGSVGILLMMTGHGREILKVSISSVILMTICAPFFISRFGIIGAAVASSIVIAYMNILLTFAVKKQLGFSVWFFRK